ncbi:MAG: glycosyltransferase family 2 protein [Bacteroidaceae bacterium]|nr:glycosyltransferase family 2 protein [Bacteroidaceae bacterium]
MKRIAVVILNWNGAEMMRKYLPSVVAFSAEADVIVADNGSTDSSLTMLAEEFPDVGMIVLDRNYGFAEGYNQAIGKLQSAPQKSTGGGGYEYVVLLNSDVEVTENWLLPLLQFMDAHSDVAACQPKLLSWSDKGSFEYAGAAGGFIDKFGYPYCRGRVFSTVEKDYGQYETVCDIHWATGACMMVRTEDYVNVGGLEGRFFAHNEEIDLCWRLRIMGRRICCVPESKVYHLGGGTLPQGNPRKTFLNFRNNLTMLYRNLPEERLASVMRWRWWLDCIAMLQSVLKADFPDVMAIVRARREYARWKKDFEQDRRKIQAQRRMNADMDVTNKSIIWEYFVRRKKKFSDL